MPRTTGGLLVTLTLGILMASLTADAQQPAQVHRIGLLSSYSADDPEHAELLASFRQGLRDLGYQEGQHFTLELRYTQGRDEALPALAADLVRLPVDVIVAIATREGRAAKQATARLPIIIVNSSDPVGAGLVTSLARPGGNVTGLSTIDPQLAGKRLQLLKEAIPGFSRLAVLWNPTNPAAALQFRETEGTALPLGTRLLSLEVRGPEDFEGAFEAASRERADGLIALGDPLFTNHRTWIVEFAAKSRLPAIYVRREFADAGGLMSYGTNYRALFRHAATYVDKILKGTKPADLPVEQPTMFEFVINLKTAKTLGLTIPPSRLFQADAVIQ